MPCVLIKRGMKGAGGPDIGELQIPVADASRRFNDMLGEVGKSSTALMMAALMDKMTDKIGVLIIDSGFDSMHIPAPNLAGSEALKEYTGGIAVLNIENPLKISGKTLPLGVSLMHELGHAIQNVNKRAWYEGNAAQAFKGDKSAKLAIENDNLASHETPICREMGLPFRTKYD